MVRRAVRGWQYMCQVERVVVELRTHSDPATSTHW
jgi:hypothetical protein